MRTISPVRPVRATSRASQPAPQDARRRRRWPGGLTQYGFLAPTFVAMVVFFLWPLVQAGDMSLHDDRTGQFTIDNYVRAVSDPRFARALGVSVLYTLAVVVGSLAVGMAIALLLNRRVRGIGILRSLFIMPWAMPFVATALIWRWMLDPQYGVLTYGLQSVGVDVTVSLFNSSAALLTVSGIEIWKTFPLAAMMLLAGMQNIRLELYEASALDGAGAWSRFLHVTLPGLRETLVSLTLLLVLWTFGRAFMVIFLTTGGGPAGATETLVLRTYQLGFQSFDLPQAASLGFIVLAIALGLTVIYRRVARDD